METCLKTCKLSKRATGATGMLLLAVASSAFAASRTETPLNTGWRFAFGERQFSTVEADQSQWQQVTLPHTWNRIGGQSAKPAEANEERGQGWYRLTFDAAGATAGSRRNWLQFDGASILSEVWLNGVPLGRHEGGVSGFRFDVTGVIRPANNQLVVKTDNTAPETPGSATAETLPMGGDWFMYGGLYRKVSLISTDALHIDLGDHGGPGIYARTLTIADGTAEVDVLARLRNDRPATAAASLRFSLVDKDGTTVATTTRRLSLKAAASAESRARLRVLRPHLWNGVKDPYLYQVRVEVMSGGEVVDSVTQAFGIRTMHLDPDRGFFLNGKKLALHGVNRHQEAGANGWAVSDAELERDYDLITEIGANTVRLAHYQHAQAEYDIADRKGLVVWAEMPLVQLSAPYGKAEATPGFIANAEQHLRELIRQNYNHPSIAVWSVSNEPNLSGLWMPLKPPTLPLLRRLAALSREEDPSRPPVLASCCGTIPGETTAGTRAPGLDSPPEAVDAFGVNVYAGWYYGQPADLGAYLDRLHRHYPGKAISVTEYGAGAGLTQHSDQPLAAPINATGRPHPEETQAAIHEASWPQLRDRDYLWGSWIWNMFDFSSPSRQEGDLVDTNNKGIVSFDRSVRKEAFYFYKAHWNPAPMLYLAGHRYLERASPLADVKAYSNAAQVRLTVNGRDMGSTSCIEHVCKWARVPLAQGDNVVQVSATHGGNTLTDQAVWHRADGQGSYRILAGQVAVTATDAGLYGSDDFYRGGEGKLLNVASFGRKAADKRIAGASDQRLYQSYRSGQFEYELPLPDGAYWLTLRFAEPDQGAQPGQRVFNVLVDDQPVIQDLDLASAAGALTAHERRLQVTVSGGRLKIGFVPRIGAAILSSLTVAPR